MDCGRCPRDGGGGLALLQFRGVCAPPNLPPRLSWEGSAAAETADERRRSARLTPGTGNRGTLDGRTIQRARLGNVERDQNPAPPDTNQAGRAQSPPLCTGPTNDLRGAWEHATGQSQDWQLIQEGAFPRAPSSCLQEGVPASRTAFAPVRTGRRIPRAPALLTRPLEKSRQKVHMPPTWGAVKGAASWPTAPS